MLGQEFRDKVKNELGKQPKYTSKVSDILKKQKITNNLGKPYSYDVIRSVFNSKTKNVHIENAILTWFKNEMDLKQQNQELKKALGINVNDPEHVN